MYLGFTDNSNCSSVGWYRCLSIASIQILWHCFKSSPQTRLQKKDGVFCFLCSFLIHKYTQIKILIHGDAKATAWCLIEYKYFDKKIVNCYYLDFRNFAATELEPRCSLSCNQHDIVLLQAHVVQAFEQSLGNMTMRLQQLQSKSERKDSELGDMKSTIDNLRRMTGLAHTEILQTTQHQALNLHTSAAQNQGTL